jgi:hypothetical protein
VNDVGFVPWKGTIDATALTGPTWYMETGAISQITTYGGLTGFYDEADLATDYAFLFGFNMQLRDNWGYEINVLPGRANDRGIPYDYFEASLGSWFNVSPSWEGNLNLSYTHGYNYAREYLASSGWFSGRIEWRALPILNLGTSFGFYVEGNPAGEIEDITYNARPYLSLTPFNDLNIRMYVDKTVLRSTGKVESLIAGLLFSYNFLPKSWIYFAFNEVRDRPEAGPALQGTTSSGLRVVDRAGVFKVKYLYYM